MNAPQLSYAHGGCEEPLIYQTIGARFDEAVGRWPDCEAFVVCDQGVRLTFAEMKREVDRLAAARITGRTLHRCHRSPDSVHRDVEPPRILAVRC